MRWSCTNGATPWVFNIPRIRHCKGCQAKDSAWGKRLQDVRKLCDSTFDTCSLAEKAEVRVRTVAFGHKPDHKNRPISRFKSLQHPHSCCFLVRQVRVLLFMRSFGSFSGLPLLSRHRDTESSTAAWVATAPTHRNDSKTVSQRSLYVKKPTSTKSRKEKAATRN